MNWFIIFCCMNLLNCVSNEETKAKNKATFGKDVFIPTHEWQVVKKGQPIPKGLHVRINLETGLTEAKLLEDDLRDDKKNALLTINQPEKEEEVLENLENSKHKLQEALKNIKNDDLTNDDEEMMKRVTQKFKKYEEIKKELEKINLSPKTDAEVLKELFKKYDNIISNKQMDDAIKNIQILNLLEDMEYLVHQIDNANEFIQLDGFEKIIYPNFNSSSTKVKCQVLNILGSSMQNNPKIQINALETGCLDKLLRILALENNNDVLARTIYAVSSLLRRFPLAQQHFIKNGGLSVFSEIFEKPQTLKLQIKIITLIYDLLAEHYNTMKHTENPDFKVKEKQYKNVNLKTRLKELKWCNTFTNILQDIMLYDSNDHDSIEKCLNVINLVQDICISSYNTTEIKNIFEELNNKYSILAEVEMKENSEDKDKNNHTFYFLKMKELTKILVNGLKIKTEL